MRRNRVLLGLAAAVAILAAACGGGDDDSGGATADGATRTVDVEMVDTAFEPDTIEVERGESVRFVFTNGGKVDHNAFIGDGDAQADHEAEMRAGEDSEGHGGGHSGSKDESAITVEPGETGGLTYTFDEAGTVEVGCHQPGHYAAGMKITVDVS